MKIEGKFGFVKALQHAQKSDTVVLLARHEQSLARLKEVSAKLGEIKETGSHVNRFSAEIGKKDFPMLLGALALGVDYTSHGKMLMDNMPKTSAKYDAAYTEEDAASPEEVEDDVGNDGWEETP